MPGSSVSCEAPWLTGKGFIFTTAIQDQQIWSFSNSHRRADDQHKCNKMKWLGFMQLLCTYRLSWTKRTVWGWWYEWDDTALRTHDSKLEPLRSEPSTLHLGYNTSPNNTESLRVKPVWNLNLKSQHGTDSRSPTFQAATAPGPRPNSQSSIVI